MIIIIIIFCLPQIIFWSLFFNPGLY